MPDSILNGPRQRLAHCISCKIDLTHSIRIKCAEPGCEDVDMCPTCFCEGKEFGNHKPWHPYRVVERLSYPILTEDWGADEELLMIDGLIASGLGNWGAAAENIGSRTKEEVEAHYKQVYHDSAAWPLPKMDVEFNIDSETFHTRKRRRIEDQRAKAMRTTAPIVLTSAPTNHEIQGYMPGRLEFETEVENEAEDTIKDIEFGLVMDYGGADQPEATVPPENPGANGLTNGSGEHDTSSSSIRTDSSPSIPNGILPISPKSLNSVQSKSGTGNGGVAEDPGKTPVPMDAVETNASLLLKLALLEIYGEKLDRRDEVKEFVFDRGLLDMKRLQAVDKKRPKEERDLINKYKPFAPLMTADDYEKFAEGLLYEMALRKKIAELQEYRSMGITTLVAAEKYERDKHNRAMRNIPQREYTSERLAAHHPQRAASGSGGRAPSHDPYPSKKGDDVNGVGGESPPKPVVVGRKPPAPLNLANAASLHLLTPAEQTLCSQLRILPKPYLVIKETFVREFAKSGGTLRRRGARKLVNIDVNKTSRIWDFLVQAGVLRVPSAGATGAAGGAAGSANGAVDMSNTPGAGSQLSINGASFAGGSQMNGGPGVMRDIDNDVIM